MAGWRHCIVVGNSNSWMVWFVLLLLWQIQHAMAQSTEVCGLQSNEVVTLTRNESTGDFQVVGNSIQNDSIIVNSGNRKRHLEFQSNHAWTLNDLHRELQSGMYVSVRRCDCITQDSDNNETVTDTNTSHSIGSVNKSTAYSWYCPVDRAICEVPASGRPRCYKASVSEFVGNLWPVVIFWFVVFGVAVSFTNMGRLTWDYSQRLMVLLLGCHPRYNRSEGGRQQTHDELLNAQLDRLMVRQPGYMVRLARNYRQRQRQLLVLQRYMAEQRTRVGLEDERQATSVNNGNNDPATAVAAAAIQMQEIQHQHRPTSLALKTRRYSASLNEGEDDKVCTICLGSILDGDRVGLLPCGHDFHVQCLKIWLQRKNQCPLCQKQQVAIERYEEGENDDPPERFHNDFV